MRAHVCPLALVLVTFGAACGGSARTQKPALSATWTAPSMFEKVPADSPYLIAVLDPMPELMRKKSFAAIDEKLTAAIAEMESQRAVDRATLPVDKRLLYAFLDEVKGKDLTHWGRDLGFDPSGRFVLYGLSVWPVLRVAVTNEARVREVIAHMLAAAGVPVVEHSLKGRGYWQWSHDKISVIASVLGGEVVFAVLPTPALPRFLPIVLGLEHPARTLAEHDRLSELTTRHRFLSTMVGYLDAKIFADILTQRAPSASTELDRPLHDALGPIDPTCKVDIDRLVAIAPRLVWGYHQIDTHGVHGSFIIETPPAITAELERLRVAVPEVSTGLGDPATFRIGLAVKLDAVLPMLRKLADHVHAQPFACSWFSPINGAVDRLADSLAKQLPPALLGFRGFSLTLDEMTREPLDIHGHAVAVGDHVADLVALAIHTLPGMQSVSVLPDGRPVQLPLALLGVPATTAGYVATRVDRAVLAIGPTAAAEVTRVLELPLPPRSPLFSFGADMQRLLELGLIDAADTSGMKNVALQLDVGPQGLAFEIYATYPATPTSGAPAKLAH